MSLNSFLRVQQVGKRLVAAAPKEVAIGNIVRRVLGLIREEAEEDREGEDSSHGDTMNDLSSGSSESQKLRSMGPLPLRTPGK